MKNYLKITLRWIPIGALLLVSFNNCSQFSEMDWDGGSNESASTSKSSAAPVLDSVALGFPIALLSAEQTLQSMAKLTNTDVPSGAVLGEYNGRYGSLAAGNDIGMANSPLMLGATSLAGEMCNSFVTTDAYKDPKIRLYFAPMNFGMGVNGLTDQAYASAIRTLARQFWGRSENTTEFESLQQYRAEYVAAVPTADRAKFETIQNLMISVCGAMLSSIDSISY